MFLFWCFHTWALSLSALDAILRLRITKPLQITQFLVQNFFLSNCVGFFDSWSFNHFKKIGRVRSSRKVLALISRDHRKINEIPGKIFSLNFATQWVTFLDWTRNRKVLRNWGQPERFGNYSTLRYSTWTFCIMDQFRWVLVSVKKLIKDFSIWINFSQSKIEPWRIKKEFPQELKLWL